MSDTGQQSGRDFVARFVACGIADPEAVQWLQNRLAEWERRDCEVPLAIWLDVPRTPTRHKLLRRNLWLVRAAQLIECGGAEALAQEYRIFLTRGTWHAWRDEPDPPADASRLRAALFRVAKAHNARPLSARQIRNIIGRQ